MRSWHDVARLLFGCITAGVLGLHIPTLEGGEPSQAFVDGLRAQRLYDTALDYLEAMRTSPLADKAFQETIDYEIGATFLEGSRLLPLAKREPELEKARSYFQKFLFDHPQHSLALSANRDMANLLIERGHIKEEQAGKAAKGSENQKRLVDESRALFQEAQKALAVADVQLNKRQKSYRGVDPNDTETIKIRDRLRSEIILTRFALTKMSYEIAQTYAPGSKENKEHLAAAVEKFGEYYRKYEPRLGAYAFRIEEARCYRELGEYPRAFVILDELATPRSYDEAGLRGVRTAAVELLLQIDLSPQLKHYKEAWASYQNWETNIERSDEASERSAAVKYLGGEAALELARGIAENNAAEAKTRADYLKRAKALLSYAARHPGDYQLKARLKLADSLLSAGGAPVETPKDYGDACRRAKLAWDQLNEAGLTREQSVQLRAEAIACFRFALAHPPAGVKRDDLVVLRYCLAYLDWWEEEYYDAAVLGEFIARRCSDHTQAPQGAEIALKSYARLVAEAGPREDHALESTRMAEIARYITERWPKTPLADEAWMMLVRAAMNAGDASKAVEYLGRIPADSPKRGDAEIMAGQLLADAYFEAVRLPEEKRPTKAKLSNLISESRKALEAGVARLRKPIDAGGAVPYPLAVGSLALARIYLELGESAKAVAMLDDAKLGAHTLAASGAKAYDQGSFRLDAFMAALRAYVAAQQFDKAAAAMNELEQAGGTANLARIYIGLGAQLEGSLKRLREEDKKDEAAKVARGFEFFLTRITARPAAESTFQALYWVANAFENLGAGAESGEGKLSPEAAGYYQKAVLAYEKIIQAAAADEKFAPAGSVTTIQIRQARCLRRLGKFKAAMESLISILKTNENRLDAQSEAAYTYQAWGEETPSYYLSAIRGDHVIERKNGSKDYLVWGWSGISRRTQDKEAFKDTFDEARYNVALCRMKYALTKKDQEKLDLLHQAEDDILNLLRLRPEMGGKKWYEQYDALLKKIQGSLGVQESKQGLKAAEEKMSAASE